MRAYIRSSIRIAIALGSVTVAALTTSHAQDFNLERGLAITDPVVLERLERRGLALDALLKRDWQQGITVEPGSNAALAAMPEFRYVMSAVLREVKLTKDSNEGSGVGMAFHHKRLFDVSYLSAQDARFPLVGVVQRLDRTYKQPDTCGEVRLIYRLEYIRQTSDGIARSRLPMTYNLVFKAKAPGDAITCQDIAKRWIASGTSALTGNARADELLSAAGPLSLVAPRLIDRIETNFQALRRPSKSVSAFGGHAEYILKVFDWYPNNPADRYFRETALENMIDRDRLISDPALLARFKAWLFEPGNLRALDQGTVVIPRDYLALRGVSVAPGGHARSGNRASYGLFENDELLRAIAAANQPAGTLKNISSPAGFRMRVDDVGCVGCHQSRAIGGFHFMGTDTAASKAHLAENAIFIAASAHFFGDAPRRRKVLETLADGKTPEFWRGFSLRPRTSQTRERDNNPRYNLIGTGYFNGWGATCYKNPARDESFRYWECAQGLECVKPHDNPAEPGIGVCMTKGRFATGDVAEYGNIRSIAFNNDAYTRVLPPPGMPLAPPHLKIDTAQQVAAGQSGGFFGGMIYRKSCRGPFPASTICARHAGNNFNECLAGAANFKSCFGDTNTSKVGLRECNKELPCRDDYICIATEDSKNGACLPPYFMMQFRVDGHPRTRAR